MKAAFVISSALALTALINTPVSVQWTNYTDHQRRQMRLNGWSSGDYFGGPQIRQPSLNQRPYNYQPGLQRNIRYRQNDCALYVNC